MSTKEYGCFFCDGKSVQYDGTCNICGKPINISPELAGKVIEGYRVIEIIGRGFYGWTLKVEDNYQPFALKIMPFRRLKGSALADKEARALAECSSHRHIARFWRQVQGSVRVLDKDVEVIGLLFDFVDNARPLSKIIADSSASLTRGDVAAILMGIASGLARLHARGLWHDDLHDDNVLVRLVGEDENLPEKFEAKLVDFGSVTPRKSDQQEHGDRSDYEYLNKHILQLALQLEMRNQTGLVAADRTFVARLRRLAQRVCDKNVSRRNVDPSEISKEIRSALEECITGHDFPSFKEMLNQSSVSLNDPLENTNALNLAPQDVARLFRDSFNWRARLQKHEPVVIVGPRGCGKTMLLRYLSIASQARPEPGEKTSQDVAARLRKVTFVGFLISVGQIRTPFIRSAYKRLELHDKGLAEEYCREYINAQFAFEVCRSIAWLQAEALVDIRHEETVPLTAYINRYLTGELTEPAHVDIQSLAETLDRRIKYLSCIPQPDSYKPSGLSRDDILQGLTDTLKTIEWAREKEIFYLLDDYSVTVLSPFVQSAYNPVLFRLSKDVRIKVTSEGSHPIREDSMGRKYKEGRELSFVNLGEVYFESDEDAGQKFFEDILDARFTETGKGSLNELKTMLGEHPAEKDFAEYILNRKRLGTARFHGFRLLCCLCSGDVSFILELLHSMTQGRWGKYEVIPPKEQDRMIKHFAQRQLNDLRTISEHGSHLYAFAEHLGNLLKQYLVESKEKGHPPDERLRIEIEGEGELSAKAQVMEDLLFRHSVLIHGGAGKSRPGLPTQRLFFRRLFAPCFPFTPSRNGCIPLKMADYERWLLDPSSIWSKPPEQTNMDLG